MPIEPYLGPERRSLSRTVRTFKPMYIEAENETTVALMRDLSTEGVGFEADAQFQVGQELLYRWGDEALRSGKVIWAKDGRFGVANDEALTAETLFPERYRSVRIPLAERTTIFSDGRRIEAQAINFSQKGFCVSVGEHIRKGALVTLQIGSRFFENTTAKWAGNDRVGFAFPHALPISEMSRLASGR